MLMVIVAPAGAAQRWSLRDDNPAGPGAGEAEGSVTFVSRNGVRWEGTPRDICPGDGYGVTFFHVLDTGAQNSTATRYAQADTDGCAEDFGIYDEGYASRPSGIRRAQAILCFTQDGECAITARRGAFKYNPQYP